MVRQKTTSSPEHIHSCLSRIRAAVNWGASDSEWQATLAAFIPALARCHPSDVAEACRRWAEDEPKWPALSQLLAKVAEAELRRDPPKLPPRRDTTQRNVMHPIIKDPVALRLRIEHIRAHPEKYVGAQALIGIGEEMLRRAGEA